MPNEKSLQRKNDTQANIKSPRTFVKLSSREREKSEMPEQKLAFKIKLFKVLKV